jgi:DNA invertase Pin-like site-specific DNA recombinase
LVAYALEVARPRSTFGAFAMANALVVRKNQLPSSQKTFRAAQYVRMSTERQRYSIQNQAAVIAAYALAHNLTIVRTYTDEGESGLRIRNRPALTRLIEDVRSGRADFDHILVYDVSRWGRFQDIDESAHYEFICKQAGIKVAYCAEQFDNDGGMVSSIVKNIKRVMAAEYSRELSAKVHAGACRFARMGFQLGGPVAYALERVLVDEKLQPKGILKKGDRKYIQTDHIRLRPGPPNDVAVVKWIFRRFLDVRSERAVARELTRLGIPPSRGERWTGPKITKILKNENYIGNIIYNRRSRKLRGNHIYNPPVQWIRSEGCIEPIVASDVFLAVKKIMEERRVDGLTDEEMLARLRRTLMKEGRLSPTIIGKTVGLPCPHVYIAHFGSIRNAYRLIGYISKRNFEYLDNRHIWLDLLSQLQSQVTAKIEKVGGRVVPNDLADGLRVNGMVNIYFRVAQLEHAEREHYAPRWMIQRRRLPDGWIVAIRLGDRSKTLLDYLLVPTTGTDRNTIRFSEKRRARLGIVRFETAEALIRSVTRRVASPSRVSPTKPAQPNRQSKLGRTRKRIVHGRH